MRISDWSSDVCSSDLSSAPTVARTRVRRTPADAPWAAGRRPATLVTTAYASRKDTAMAAPASQTLITQWTDAMNTSDIAPYLSSFTDDAVLPDPSVGERFVEIGRAS